MATIDTGKIEALIEARLIAGVSGLLVYVPMHETPGEGDGACVQLVSVDEVPEHQQQAAETDGQRVVVIAQVTVPRTHGSAHALAGALEIARRALDRQTIDDLSSSGHMVRLDRARTQQDPAAFGARDARSGVVSVEGTAQRGTGTDRTEYLS